MPKVNLLNAQAIGELVALVNQDHLSEAEDNARTLLATHPNVGMLWKILGVALVRQGKDALSALRKSAELMADDAEAHKNLGTTLCDQGQWALGLESLRRALALAPLDTDCLVETAASFRQALTLNPAYVEALINLGNVLREIGQRREAVPLFEQAIKLDPGRVEAHWHLGSVFFELRRVHEAAASYARALALKPD